MIKKEPAYAFVLALLTISSILLTPTVYAAGTPATPFGYSYIGKITFTSIDNYCNTLFWTGVTTVTSIVCIGSSGTVCWVIGIAVAVPSVACLLVKAALAAGYTHGVIYVYLRCWWNFWSSNQVTAIIRLS